MDSIIQQAIRLRKQEKFSESRALLEPLLDSEHFAAQANLHIAWSFDNEGRESDAVPHYKSALLGTLSETERFDTLFGLACTYRSLGDYRQALEYFDQTISEFPEADEVRPFYAMCLYNLGRHKEAVSLLLDLLVATTNSDAIKEYQRAILLYSKDLDRTW
ncbi:tetratricopeptide repeat protein [Vibrio hangzhouensis]|uniref:Tetratrico peptide repeat-containing protein n=1 Tax=Vibrio hangzhouensis TaxID=462991 RepID=A0A1H5S328_9VIBR|nr:tetratricopeptide repeat protein [Vibrio hangzhouensis]SEF45043.1 Tetratrico peptide repeat-containing protein [Vibrio hangzhouensis]